jgi:membrane associated rhomboid family serine protease
MLLPLRDDNPTVRTPYVTCGLIAVNLLVMLWLSLLSPQDQQTEVIRHGFIPARVAQLTHPNLVVKVPIEEELPARDFRFAHQQQRLRDVELEPASGQIAASLLTSMFLHGGWLHVLGNMWFLWIFGNNIEERLGSWLYLGFYLVGGLLAMACHWANNPQSVLPVVGASGAVATILGAYAVTFPKASVRTLVFFGIITVINIPALVWLGLWLAGQLLDAFLNRDLGVAVWAHIGGFVAGAVLMPILSFGPPPPGGNWEDEIKKHFSWTPSDGR